MQALIITYHYLPENVPSVVRLRCFQKYLPEFGCGCRVLSSSTTPWHTDPEGLVQSEDVVRTPQSGCQKRILKVGNRLALLLNHFLHFGDYGDAWLPYALRSAGKILREAPGTVLFSSSPPSAAHLAALRLKRRFGCPWIADFQDPLAANPFSDPHPLARRWDAAVEAKIVERADSVIANTDSAADALRARYPQWRDKITFLFNGYDPDEPCEPAPLPARTYRVLSHVGSIYGARHPHILLAAVDRLMGAGRLDPTRFKMDFTGPFDDATIPDLVLFRSLLARGCLEINRQYLPRRDALRKAAESDFLLLIDVNAQGASLQVPSKVFDYLRIGRPILALTARGSPVERILKRSAIPYRCIHYDQTTPEETDAALLSLIELGSTPVRADPWFWEEFDARNQTRRLAEIMRAL
jgi:hypothetical protein